MRASISCEGAPAPAPCFVPLGFVSMVLVAFLTGGWPGPIGACQGATGAPGRNHSGVPPCPPPSNEKEPTVRADIAPGGTFPDYELTDHTKTRRKLSELQGIDPMILVLSRGHFCPKDHQQHLQLAAFHPQIAVAYTQIVTITTDNILELNEFRAAVGAEWTFLSDAGRKVQKDLE